MIGPLKLQPIFSLVHVSNDRYFGPFIIASRNKTLFISSFYISAEMIDLRSAYGLEHPQIPTSSTRDAQEDIR